MSKFDTEDRGALGYFLTEDGQSRLRNLHQHIVFLSRLAEPRVMAAAVMGTTVEEIGKQIASGQNRAVQVPQKIPVYVSYFTAWPNKDGVVEYFDDVYGRDGHTAKAFKATTDARAPRV